MKKIFLSVMMVLMMLMALTACSAPAVADDAADAPAEAETALVDLPTDDAVPMADAAPVDEDEDPAESEEEADDDVLEDSEEAEEDDLQEEDTDGAVEAADGTDAYEAEQSNLPVPANTDPVVPYTSNRIDYARNFITNLAPDDPNNDVLIDFTGDIPFALTPIVVGDGSDVVTLPAGSDDVLSDEQKAKNVKDAGAIFIYDSDGDVIGIVTGKLPGHYGYNGG